MNTRKISYWATTGLLSFAFVGSGIAKIAGAEAIVANMTHLGVPSWMTPLLGAWMIAGALALLVPGFERVKEWAYAGIFFQMTGGFIGHLAVGDSLGAAMPPLVLAGLAVASYLLRPEDRTKFAKA